MLIKLHKTRLFLKRYIYVHVIKCTFNCLTKFLETCLFIIETLSVKILCLDPKRYKKTEFLPGNCNLGKVCRSINLARQQQRFVACL